MEEDNIFHEQSRLFGTIEKELGKLIQLAEHADEQRAEMIKLLQAILDTTQGTDVASFGITIDKPEKQ
jgi:hypothetical protein